MMNDSTKIMGSPPGSTAAAEVETQCPHCASALHDDEQFCQQCGYQRGTWAGTAEPGTSAAAQPAIYELRSTAGQAWPVYPGENEIGRGEVAIMLANPYASRRHARIVVGEDGAATLEDLGSSNGTQLDGRTIPANVPQPLAPGAEFSIGQETFALALHAAPDSGETAPASHAAEADMAPDLAADAYPPEPGEQGELPASAAQAADDAMLSPWSIEFGSGEMHTLPVGETILGRKAADGGIVVAGDGYVSGSHCKLHADFDNLAIEDLGSTNGTFVEGAQLEPGELMPLAAGSSVRIGQTTFTVGRSDPVASETEEETADE